MVEPTFRERLATIEADGRNRQDILVRIEQKLDTHIERVDTRISRLERLGAAGSALVAGFCFWVKITLGKP